MVSSSHLFPPWPASNSFIQWNMLYPWGTGHPYSDEARAEADGYLGSLACRGALEDLSQTPGIQCVSSHVESGFRPWRPVSGWPFPGKVVTGGNFTLKKGTDSSFVRPETKCTSHQMIATWHLSWKMSVLSMSSVTMFSALNEKELSS